jgi:hypothetical protein
MRNTSCFCAAYLIFAAGLVLTSCVRVPDADELASGPRVDELVQRIKCDVHNAVTDRLSKPYGYEWLHLWTAQANLNLIVNDQSQISPGAVFTQPLTTASLPLRVTNMARSWNLGLGAQASNTATRNETITFTVSMSELMHEFGTGYHKCEFPNSVDLRSELGLVEWISASLSPADQGHLSLGYHKTPKTGTGSTTAKATSQGALKSIGELNLTPEGFECVDSKPNSTEKSKRPDRAWPSLAIVICDLFTVLDYDFGALDGGQVKFIAKTVADIQRAIQDLMPVKTRAARMTRMALEKTAIELTIFLDPPIDTITHQIQFIIVWNASATPSWTLLHFKGPSPASGALLSATITKTHTLNIAFGPPSSPDTQGALNALQVGTAVSNALGAMTH